MSPRTNPLRFRLRTLLIIVAIISVLLAFGIRFPSLVITATLFIPCALMASLVAYASRSRLIFYSGLAGGYLGAGFNPFGSAFDRLKSGRTTNDSYPDWLDIALAQPDICTGAIVAMAVAAIVCILLPQKKTSVEEID